MCPVRESLKSTGFQSGPPPGSFATLCAGPQAPASGCAASYVKRAIQMLVPFTRSHLPPNHAAITSPGAASTSVLACWLLVGRPCCGSTRPLRRMSGASLLSRAGGSTASGGATIMEDIGRRPAHTSANTARATPMATATRRVDDRVVGLSGTVDLAPVDAWLWRGGAAVGESSTSALSDAGISGSADCRLCDSAGICCQRALDRYE
mmetsp:Transcript_13747/g.34666  ORF Transcript_13747/g.34666 Transcript_13747/m.34666 type:complete len:207 (+) Transcript_13747:391-1011(+)